MSRPRPDADPHPNVSMREILSRHGSRWNRPEVREIWCENENEGEERRRPSLVPSVSISTTSDCEDRSTLRIYTNAHSTFSNAVLQPEHRERNQGGNRAVRRIIIKACLQPLKDSIPDEIKKPYRQIKQSYRRLLTCRRGVVIPTSLSAEILFFSSPASGSITSSQSESKPTLAVMNPNNPVDMVRAEMTFYADMFNKMTELCFKKCVPKFHETELSTGELVCADRCVAKYVDATNKVGEIMQAAQMAQVGAAPPPQ